MNLPFSLWSFSILGFPLLMGLSSSFSHCLGMCGPIQWGLYAGLRDKNGLVFYHLGRGIAYLILGVTGGLVGGAVHALQSPFATRAFILMLVVLYLAFAFMYFTQNFSALEKGMQTFFFRLHTSRFFLFNKGSLSLPTGSFSNLTRRKLLLAGIAGGWLPCPMTLGVVTWGLSAPHPGIAVAGMFLLWVGTFPSFLLHYYLGGRRMAWSPKAFRLALFVRGTRRLERLPTERSSQRPRASHARRTRRIQTHRRHSPSKTSSLSSHHHP